MLRTHERFIIFSLFCLFLLGLFAVEIITILNMMNNDFNIWSTLFSFALGIAGMGSILFLFKGMIRDNFMKPSTLSSESIREYVAQRNIILDQHKLNADQYDTCRQLVQNTLAFAEKALRGWIPGRHFELCVFVDKDNPLLFAYFDSQQRTVSRSFSKRAGNPNYYSEKEYEIVRLLQDHSSRVVVINDTLNSKQYHFATEAQKTQIKSTLLQCIDVSVPCGIVITSDIPKAFDEKNATFMSFFHSIAGLVRYDLFERDVAHHVREFRPDLFSQKAT